MYLFYFYFLDIKSVIIRIRTWDFFKITSKQTALFGDMLTHYTVYIETSNIFVSLTVYFFLKLRLNWKAILIFNYVWNPNRTI